MKYRVVPSLWRPAPNQVFKQGDVVDEAVLARIGPISSWRRLGLIVPTDQRAAPKQPAETSPWWKGLTKTQLVEAATQRGIQVDATKTKKQILDLIKEGS